MHTARHTCLQATPAALTPPCILYVPPHGLDGDHLAPNWSRQSIVQVLKHTTHQESTGLVHSGRYQQYAITPGSSVLHSALHQRSRRPALNQRTYRPFTRHPQQNLIPPLTHHPAHSIHYANQAKPADTKDPHPCLYGMRCGPRAFSMGQSSAAAPRQDWSYERCRRSILAAGDSREQPQVRAEQ